MSRARDLADSADLNFDDGTLVIDSGNNRVGIGTSSPSSLLTLQGSGTTDLTITAGASNSARIRFGDTGDVDIGQILYYNADNSMQFVTNTSEAMRIDSSGNLLVGKTDISLGVAGHRFDPSGFQYLTRNNAIPLYVNRLTSDGELIRLNKNGSTVGSIGTSNTHVYIVGQNRGIRADTNQVSPVDSSGATTDGVYNIGSSGARFKDLYLSGGVYLGGTGAANHLDDYEEGTWTPTITSGGFTGFSDGAHYIKIGRQVTIILEGSLQGTGNSSSFVIGNLPFPEGLGEYQAGSMYAQNYNSEGSSLVTASVATNTSEIRFVEWGEEAIGTDFGSGYFAFNITYITTA